MSLRTCRSADQLCFIQGTNCAILKLSERGLLGDIIDALRSGEVTRWALDAVEVGKVYLYPSDLPELVFRFCESQEHAERIGA